MSFDVAAESYGRYMGRFADPLATSFVAWAGVPRGARVLDVGCGPGALTSALLHTLDGVEVTAVDPSAPFVAAIRERFPEVEVAQGSAEALPYPAESFDAVMAQLVVHFMADPVGGIAEMARVARPGGLVAATVWDGATGPLGPFWAAARSLDPEVRDEADLPGAREGDLEDLFRRAGLSDLRAEPLAVSIRCERFEEWWEPFTLGVGPAGDYLVGLDEPTRAELRDRCRAMFPAGPFDAGGIAWSVVGRAR